MFSIVSFLTIGFLFGLRHAFDADHIAAVSLLAIRSPDPEIKLRHGIWWGFGHTATLFVIGFLILVFGISLPPEFSHFFEVIIFCFLIVLGAWSLLRRKGTHDHPPLGKHRHPSTSFFVGIIHGLAGSGALTIFIVSTIHSAWLGLVYLLLFGFGSILGMTLVVFSITKIPTAFMKYFIHVGAIFSILLGFFGLFLF